MHVYVMYVVCALVLYLRNCHSVRVCLALALTNLFFAHTHPHICEGGVFAIWRRVDANGPDFASMRRPQWFFVVFDVAAHQFVFGE